MTGRRQAAARRLWAGSGVLGRRAAARLTAWVRAGRRTDLKGWSAVLGCVLRAGVLLGAAYVLLRIVRAVPALLWALAPAWCVLAYRAGAPPKTAVRAPEEAPAAAPDDPRRALARWLLQTIGDRPGIHLRELYPAMRTLPGHEGYDDAALRGRLQALGVRPVRSLRVGGVAGRSGVRRADAEALLSPAESGPGEQHGDAGQGADSPVLSTVGERAESA